MTFVMDHSLLPKPSNKRAQREKPTVNRPGLQVIFVRGNPTQPFDGTRPDRQSFRFPLCIYY